ncbi:MAG: hypothetical protein LQ347_001109 [Umbilicaria vellea]|nr:MAG: hypothetical protein LQ347_001109 [Umbilicaria vellea]
MASFTSIYSPSYEKLKALQESAKARGSTNLTLPERPEGSESVPNRYLNSAISMLGESAASLYANHHYLDIRLDDSERNINEQVTKIDGTVRRVERKVNEDFRYIQKQLNGFERKVDEKFDDVQNQFTEVRRRFNAVDYRFDEFKDNVNQRFDEAKAINFNLLASSLESPIRKIAAHVQDRNGQKKYEVGAGFPETVEEFWLLKSNIAQLTSLARHYSIEGWKKWPRLDQGKPRPAQDSRLEDAVAAYPERCLRILAATWGLNYPQLERLETDTEKMPATAQKRKVEDETEPRRVKAKVGSACETEISILSGKTEEVIVRRKTTTAEPEVRFHHQTTLEEVMREYNVPGHPRPLDVESAELGWETSSSTRAARHLVRARVGLDPPAPDERHRVPRSSKVLVDKRPKVSDD